MLLSFLPGNIGIGPMGSLLETCNWTFEDLKDLMNQVMIRTGLNF